MRKIYYCNICAQCKYSMGDSNDFYCTLDNDCIPTQESFTEKDSSSIDKPSIPIKKVSTNDSLEERILTTNEAFNKCLLCEHLTSIKAPIYEEPIYMCDSRKCPRESSTRESSTRESSKEAYIKDTCNNVILASIDYQISNLKFSIKELENLRETVKQLLEKGEDYSTIYDTIYYNQFYKKFK